MSSSPPELKPHDNGTWYIHWTDGRRSKRVSTRQKDLRQAKVFFAEWLKLEAEAPLTVSASTYTVEELWTIYTSVRTVVNEQARQSSWLNLKPHFGHLLVTQVNDDVIDDYFKRRSSGEISPRNHPAVSGTIRKELGTLAGCFNWAGRRKRRGNGKKSGGGLIAPNEVPQFELPAASRRRERWLSDRELNALIGVIEDETRQLGYVSKGALFTWMAIDTAPRKSAILELPWSRVDFDIGVIHYPDPNREQTTKRRADVPMSDRLRPIMERAFLEKTGPLVTGRFDAYHYVQKMADRAGLVGVGPHVLRHTAASHMARRGVPLWIVAKILGDTLATTERVYAKFCPDDLRPGVNVISGALKRGAA